ncbi:HupE/UreJ family protein [Pseudomonas paeninsulae]|uniref:HupE/UreJ family protein n=1 Tax=Pseudomonas paeninsulae TaxID=3110772 RepID=UPI002D771A3B|nr:HupE/UreJ family protein [Pseudomonas sp. IT1137]
MRWRGLRVLLVIGALAAGWSQLLAAHELRLGYLQLDEVSSERYSVLWKLPALGDSRLALRLQLSEQCPAGGVQVVLGDNSFVQRWQIDCPTGLAGKNITVAGLTEVSADVLVRISRLDGSQQSARLSAAQPAFNVTATPGLLELAASYFVLGVEHILIGIDHLFFVLALLLLVSGVRRLVWTVTAFTVAHSITLSLATLDLLRVSIAPVEAVIALSIVFVAAEVVRQRRGGAGLAMRAPWLVAFAFGLLHGLGFASALQEVGLPQVGIPLALLAFNLGVESGQLLFILVVLLLRYVFRLLWPQTLQWPRLLLPYVLGSVAMTWVIQRVVAF